MLAGNYSARRVALALVALILNAPPRYAANRRRSSCSAPAIRPPIRTVPAPATAIVVNDTPYLVDFGAGVVRRAKSAVVDRGIAALDPVKLRVVVRDAPAFRSHRRLSGSDPDAVGARPPRAARSVRTERHRHMTEHVMEAYSEDFATRTKDRKLYTVGAFPEGHAVNAHEIKPGVVYKDANVTVTAFATKHAMESYGYRFDTPDRSIVISGDTNPTQATIDACRGCDVLIHEVLTHDWLSRRPDFQAYAAAASTPRRRSSWSWRSRRSRACWFCITRRCRCVRRWTRSARRRRRC